MSYTIVKNEKVERLTAFTVSKLTPCNFTPDQVQNEMNSSIERCADWLMSQPSRMYTNSSTMGYQVELTRLTNPNEPVQCFDVCYFIDMSCLYHDM